MYFGAGPGTKQVKVQPTEEVAVGKAKAKLSKVIERCKEGREEKQAFSKIFNVLDKNKK